MSRLKWEYSILAVVVTMGIAARLNGIDYNFVGDEVFSVQLASKPFAEVISESLRDTPHPPLHNILLHLWIKAFGASEISVRTLSILFSAAFLLMTYRFFRRLLALWLALGLLSIFALSPFFVYYGQQARPYALIALLSIVNLMAFLRLIERACDPRAVVTWAASCLFLLYSQYLAILLVVFQVGFALFYLRADRDKILTYGLLVIASIVPWAIASFCDAIRYTTDPLALISWMRRPNLVDFALFYVSLFGDPSILRACCLLAIFTVLGVAYIRHLITSKALPVEHVLLFLIGILMPIVVYAVSVWGPKPVFAARQLLVSAIAFIAFIGLCISTLPRGWATASLLILIGLTLAALPESSPRNARPPWREVAKVLDTQYPKAVVVAQEKWVSRPLSYYRRAGSVKLWNDLGEDGKMDRFLFVCRPFRCSDVETETLKSRHSLIKTWRWAHARNIDKKYTQLRLYEISRAQ
jgi:uncharacterized membrane protein